MSVGFTSIRYIIKKIKIRNKLVVFIVLFLVLVGFLLFLYLVRLDG